jgi:nucleotide-binding universal stress UspA family protein
MESRDSHARAPIVAAFKPETGAFEPVEFGVAASRVTGAPLIIVAVTAGVPIVHQLADDVRPGVEHLRARLREHRVYRADIREYTDSSAPRGLMAAIKQLQPELVVVGATGRRRVPSALLGSTAGRVVHSSGCPIAVVPRGYRRPEEGVQVVGAAFAPTDDGREALKAAAKLARAGGVRLRAITVVSPEESTEQPRAQLRAAVDDVAKDLEVEVEVVVNDAAEGLVDASRTLDMLVVGSRGLAPRRAAMAGSVARHVVQHAACPVLVLPRGADERRDALVADAELHASQRS